MIIHAILLPKSAIKQRYLNYGIKSVSLMFFMFLTIGCATSLPNADHSDTNLSPTESIILIVVHANYSAPLNLRFRTEKTIFPLSNPTAVNIHSVQGNQLRAFKIDVGEGIAGWISDVFLSQVTVHWNESMPVLKSRIVPGKINYIGDLVIEEVERTNFYIPTFKSYFVDNEKDTIRTAKLIYPELFSKYSYVNSVPQGARRPTKLTIDTKSREEKKTTKYCYESYKGEASECMREKGWVWGGRSWEKLN